MPGADAKIFCIGLNKTGTTSLETALRELGFDMGDQWAAEKMFDHWVKRDFRWLWEFCRTATAFQDAPFSFPYTYVYLDQAFPGSKFILTERDTPEQWYESLTRYHGEWGRDEGPPTKADLLRADYQYPGFLYHAVKHLFNTEDDDLYNKDALLAFYRAHEADVKTYFKYRPESLLVLNVARSGAMRALCEFLEVEPRGDDFPHEVPHR